MSNTLPTAVYLLCLATSIVCGILLARSYLRERSRLLLWVALGFAALAINNLFLVGDLVIFPNLDLLPARQISGLTAVGLFLYGFIWEADR